MGHYFTYLQQKIIFLLKYHFTVLLNFPSLAFNDISARFHIFLVLKSSVQSEFKFHLSKSKYFFYQLKTLALDMQRRKGEGHFSQIGLGRPLCGDVVAEVSLASLRNSFRRVVQLEYSENCQYSNIYCSLWFFWLMGIADVVLKSHNWGHQWLIDNMGTHTFKQLTS